jgi:hypothetical protein
MHAFECLTDIFGIMSCPADEIVVFVKLLIHYRNTCVAHCMTCMEAFWLETVLVMVLGKCLGTPVDFTICFAAMG